jgi:glyoxylase-like metal-dependent hydrolase (beta-lactamase superfamily II)
VHELRAGVWWWTAVHPEWTTEAQATEDWGPEVSSYAIEDRERLLLFDPTLPPSPVAELAARRDVVIVLTCPWHQRAAPTLVERFGASVFAPPADAPDGSELASQAFVAGDSLPIGVEAFPGMEPNDLVLWIPSRRALVIGDTLIDRGRGFEFPADWANKGVAPETILEGLRPLLKLPVELVLPTHGAPTDRDSLNRAIAAP